MRLSNTLALIALLAAMVFGLAACNEGGAATAPKLPASYYAVLLSNGQVYFGHLEGLGTAFPILREVYYVQSGVDKDTKEQKNILLKRGGEWHAPDQMILNANQIVLIEPVGANSRVSELIAQLKK
jgi:hypothetical protein